MRYNILSRDSAVDFDAGRHPALPVSGTNDRAGASAVKGTSVTTRYQYDRSAPGH